MALERQLIPPYEPPAAAQDLGITAAPHHVCLLRAPELVVKYHPGPEPVSSNLAYAAVFRAFDDMDRTYAAAEPPTHDDWVFAQLEGAERTFVRTTFTRIKEQLAEFARPAAVRSNGVKAPLGAASNFLGPLVAAATGSGAASALVSSVVSASVGGLERQQEKTEKLTAPGGETTSPAEVAVQPPNRVSRSRASVRLDGEPYFQDSEIGLLLVQDVVVVGNGPVTIRGTVGITVADGSREQEPPEGSEQPVVMGWRFDSGEQQGDVAVLEAATAGQRLSLVVRPVPDTITQLDVTVVRGEGVVPYGG